MNIANAANTIISSIGLYANDVATIKSKVPAGSPSVTTAAIAVLEIANKLPQLFLPFFTILSKTPTNKTTEPTCIFADLNRTIDSALDFTLNLTSTIDSFHVPMADYLANTMQAALSCLYQQTIVVQDHLDSLGSTIMSLRLAGTTVTTANVLTGLPATFITTFTTALTKLNTCLQDLEKSVRLSVSLIQSANNILLNFNTTVVNAKRTIATFTTTYNNSLFLTTTNFQRSVQTMRTNIKNTYTQVVARLITFKTLIVGPIVSSANQFAVDTYNSLESLYAADYMAVSPQILQDLNTNPDGINYIISLANDLTNEIANAMMKDARGKAVSCGNPATSAINSALSDIIYLIETNCGIAAVSQVQTLLGASYNALLNDLQTKAVDYAKYLNACLNSNSQVCLDKVSTLFQCGLHYVP